MKKFALRLVSFAAPLALTATAFAQDAPMTDAEATAIAGRALAAGLAIGILALIESLAIYALVIAFQVQP
jgi:F0F1-type ATP synthase membrane subunit c/vacuolar-type H+-ATPase subunit K